MNKTKKIVLAGLLAAMVAVGTMVIHIPTPTGGYIHIGDSLVYISGILLGPIYGGLAAAIGSMLSDILLGYTAYALPTFLIKGLDALVVAVIYTALSSKDHMIGKREYFAYTVAFLVGGFIMAMGYLGYETMTMGYAKAVLSLPANLIQAFGGGLIGYPILAMLSKTKLNTIHTQ